jgi:TolB-like protein/DNA-binding winged helix-turn-helix (wHTH) protein
MEKRDKIHFDGWSVDTRSGELWRGGAPTSLPEQALRILVELASHPGEVVSREQLIQRLWPQGVVDFDAGLNTAMRKLRVALDDVGEKPRYIETLPRRGYRFIGKLEAGDPTDAEPAALPNAAPVEQQSSSRVARGRRLAFAALAIVVVGVSFLIFRPHTESNDASPTRVRMAVVPFENLSPDPDNAFFADGLHEQTLAVLSERARDIEVISRTTMTTYRNRRPSAIELANALGATHVLTGVVRRDRDDVRLDVELIDARTDRHLWSRTFERKLTDATTLQSDVAAEIAAQLSSHLDTAAAQAKMTRNVAAFDLYLKARQEVIANFRSVDRTAGPIALLTQAIERDPDFAHAYAERAVDNFLAFVGNWDVTQARLDLVRADIDAARRLAPNDPVIRARHAPYTAFMELAPQRALEQISQGARLGHPDALEMQSLILWSMGRPDESDLICRRILELDPLNGSIRVRRVSVLYAGRHWRQALIATRELPSEGEDLGELVRFEITGESPALASTFANATTFSDLGRNQRDPAVSLATYLLYMRLNHRFGEAQKFLNDFPLQSVRFAPSASGALPGLGSRPVDEHRAWLALLSGEPAQAARFAKGVRAFLRETPQTPWNAWYLRMLSAEADLFEGHRAEAAQATRESLAMSPSREANVRTYRYRERMAAAVFAWSGAQDEAVKLLHSLAYDIPVIGAAAVARDPFYTVPLALNAEYRKLQAALEQEIRSLQTSTTTQSPTEQP